VYGVKHIEIAHALDAKSIAIIDDRNSLYNGDLEKLPTHILVLDNNPEKGMQSELLDLSDHATRTTFIQQQVALRGGHTGFAIEKAEMTDEERAACLAKLPKNKQTSMGPSK
jgi:hypothetical protein